MLALLAFALYLPLRFAPLFEPTAVLEIDRAGEGGAHVPGARRVLLVSIDGLAPRVLAEARTPFLDRLAAEGVAAAHAETVVPPITLTSHASMLSGLSPEEHGVDFNRVQPWRELRFPTAFSACAELGRRCGLFAGKRKFVHFAEFEPGVERYAFGADMAGVLAAAGAWAAANDPDFLFVHLAEVDLIGHEFGWGSAEQVAAIEEADGRLASFVATLGAASARPLAVLVTSDHGGFETGHHQDRPENRVIPWIVWGAPVPAGLDLGKIETTQTHDVVRTWLQTNQ